MTQLMIAIGGIVLAVLVFRGLIASISPSKEEKEDDTENHD